MCPTSYYKHQHKNNPRYCKLILRKINGLEGIIGHHLIFLKKQYIRNDKVYDKINSKPSSAAAKDTKFYIINNN